MGKTSSLATVGIGGLLLAIPAFGHHAFSAEFDANKPITLTGTVTSVEWQNPHTWFYIDVKDEAGNIANWGLELASPNLLLRNGWTRNTMKVGDVVTVESFRAKNGSNIANARSITLTATVQKLLGGSSQGGRTQ
jgi:DNA/RNA endonuclease YhcR with UshA esterase domain